ncbi:hypothetical protein Micbo1qcDRAFT_162029, partial [Microdochium bolleyi]
MLSSAFNFSREDRSMIRECLRHGRGVPAEDIAQIRQASLMVGAEAWLDLIACAASMMASREQELAAVGEFRDPFEGRDVFGYVARILADQERAVRMRRRQRRGGMGEGRGSEGVHAGNNRTVDAEVSTATSQGAPQVEQGKGLPDKGIKRGSRRAAESPYWLVTPSSANDGAGAGDNCRQDGRGEAKRQRKKAKR